jgi:hypothetical protein
MAGPREVRVAGAHGLAIAAARSQRADSDVRVALEQPDQLAAAIAGGADEAHVDGGARHGPTI